MSSKDTDAIREEIGDVLFTIVNLARHLGVDADAALARSNAKFEHRFSHVEKRMRSHELSSRTNAEPSASSRPPEPPSLELLEQWWNEAKND